MIGDATKDLSRGYSSWFGKSVVLHVIIRRHHVPMLCSIVGESAADVRIRVQPGWEMNVRKELILGVEHDAVVPDARMNFEKLHEVEGDLR